MSAIDNLLKTVSTTPTRPTVVPVQNGPTGNEPASQVLRNAGKSFLPSLGNAFKSLTPKGLVSTGKQLAQAALGAFMPSHAGGDLVTPQTQNGTPLGPDAPTVPVTQSKPVQAFNQFGASFEGGALAGKGKQGFVQKLETDPVGLLLDNLLALDTVGGGIGKVGDVTGFKPLSTAGDLLQKTAENANPVSAPFKVAGAVLEKIGGPSKTLNTSVINDAKDLGIDKNDLPIQATSNNHMIQKAAGFLQGGFFGRKLTKVAADLKGELTDIASKTTKELPEAEAKGVLGQRVSDALDKADAAHSKALEAGYDDFTNQYGTTPASATNSVAAIKKIITDYQTSATPAPKATMNFLQQTLDNLNSGKGAVLDKARESGFTSPAQIERITKALEGEPDAPSNTTFKTLKATRTVVGHMLDAHPELKPLYRALSEDRTTSLDAIDNTAAGKIKALDSDYAEFKGAFGDAVSRKVHNSTPEQVVNQFIKGDNATTLAKLKDRIDPGTFQAIGTSWIAKAVDKATDENGKFDPQTFIKNVDQLDEPTKKVLLSPQQQDMLNEASDTFRKVQRINESVARNNNVGSFAQTRMILQGAGIPLALLMGNTGTIKSIAALLSGEYLGSKFFGSDLGRQILTTGIPAVEKAGQITKNAGTVVGETDQTSNALGARK